MFHFYNRTRSAPKLNRPAPKGRRYRADANSSRRLSAPSFKLVAIARGRLCRNVTATSFYCNAGRRCSTGHFTGSRPSYSDQAAQLIHMCCPYYYAHPEMRRTREIVPVPSPTSTHFANSGTEAVATALKLRCTRRGARSSSPSSTAFTAHARLALALHRESRSAGASAAKRST